MKTIRLSVLIASMVFSSNLFSQISGFRKDNLLLPEKLIISEQVGFDSLYLASKDSVHRNFPSMPIFDFKTYIDIKKVIVDKVLAGFKVFDPSQANEDFPYSALDQNEPLALTEIQRNLGQRADTVRKINDDGTIEVMVAYRQIEPKELSSFNFIEGWSLTANPLNFHKEVFAYEPVRRYLDDFSDFDKFRYRKAFRLYNNPNYKIDKSKLKLAAQVKYEHLFNFDGVYRNEIFSDLVAKRLSQNDLDFQISQIYSNTISPFFNGFNQLIFIKTLLDNVYSGNAIAYDYYTSAKLTPQEAKGRVIIPKTLIITNPLSGENEERTIEADLTSEIISVVFTEEWYFDEETLQLEKKVVGIAPVRYFYDWANGQEVIKRQILFTINLP
ncbi:MAG: hypothetical protein HXX16_08775 [Bacteroidales bacterium]|nr:hypothetical protein [Bacteroidales bacterium]